MVRKKQKTEKKEPGIYKRIVKWIGLTLLAVLIILALIFQAPWKVIALLLIILAACTVLPKPYRKWFWLSVAVIVLVLIIWVFLPEDNEGWRPYTFDEEFTALQAKYAIPDSENAATIYNNLLEDYDPNTMRTDFLDPNLDNLTRREPWSSQDYPELAKWLQDHQDTITTLIEASQIEKCRFTIYADPVNSSRTSKRLAAMRLWTFLLTTAANNDLGQGHADEALEKYMAVLQMGKHLCQQPTLIDMLVGVAVESVALRGYKMFIVTSDATEQRLDTIEQAVADIKYDWRSDWLKLLEDEKLMAKNRFGEYYERDLTGRIRLSRDPKARIRKLMKDFLVKFPKGPKLFFEILWSNPSYWQRKLIRAKTILYWFYLPSRPQKGAETIDAFYEKYYKRADADFDWKKEPEEISPGFRLNFTYLIKYLVDLTTIFDYRFHDIYLRVTADNQGSRLIVALRRYKNKTGQWPEKLDDIKSVAPAEIFVDPINGGSFVYKLTEEIFTLYSKGGNNIDEGGKRDRESGEDDWLIWPTSSHKTKKEKADDEQQQSLHIAIERQRGKRGYT